MALTQINTRSNVGQSDIDNSFLCQDKLFIGHDALTLTEMDTTTVPQITEGSVFEIGGALFQAATAQSISTTDPHTSSTVADGTVYIFINGTDGEPYFTATAPTWDDDKQGWYGTSTYANYRYVPILMTKSGSSYSSKKRFNYLPGFDGIYMDADGNMTIDGNLTVVNRRIVSGSRHGSYTEDQLFDYLSPYIPNVGDDMILFGGFQSGTEIGICSRAERTSSTVITAYMLTDVSGNPTALTQTIIDGNASGHQVSLCW